MRDAGLRRAAGAAPRAPEAGVPAGPGPVFSPGALRAALAERWGLDEPRLRTREGKHDLNVHVDDAYVLKISHTEQREDAVDLEIRAMEHARACDPGLPVPAVVATVTGARFARLLDDGGRCSLARLTTRLPGTALEGGGPLSLPLAEQVGAIAGRTGAALSGFFHPAAGRPLLWDVRRLPQLLDGAGPAAAPLRELAERVTPALRATATLPSGVQHADVTLTNVLAASGRVTGLIDFGDVHHTATVCDLAATLTSVLRGAGDDPAALWPLTDAVLRGYRRHRTLGAAEIESLGELVIARLVTTLAVSAIRSGHHQDRRRTTRYDASTLRVLELLTAPAPDDLADRLERLAGSRNLAAAIPEDTLAGRRDAAMGGPPAPSQRRAPLEIVRGEGPWLFSPDNTRYLDAYDHVALIGHAHPTVTAAVGRQMAELNTHAGHLHSAVVDLAERLLATMPPGLDTCLFTTSGAEANDLARQLAGAYTGARGAIVAGHARHGSSRRTADLSSAEWPDGRRPDLVAVFEAPHGPAAGLTAEAAAGRIAAADGVLRAAGQRPALVLADPQFTSEGVLDAPGGFFAGLAAGAHAAGALYLADEVRSGFGRGGPGLWRFTATGVTPDIVTLGGPMGAGYPIGAVVTRREIAGRLTGGPGYVPSGAATPVAAAAGHAVLDVLELTGLPERAVGTGAELRRRITEVADGSPLLGAVRGTGLLAGVDVRADGGRTSRENALRLRDALVERRVLAGLTGARGDVLTVRPPLVWGPAEVFRFTDALGHAVADLRD